MTRDGRRLAGGAAALLAGLMASGCYAPMVLTENDADRVLSRQELADPSPAQPGDFSVQTLYYGSGTDRHRPEYGDSVDIVTDSVDGSAFARFGAPGNDREDYWGFSDKGMPINGRVWYPEGEGRFPLVLVVHGNHDPTDYSDPGYDYLGELLASRGYILASVDMNFINGGLRGENDARGWLLLKHLEAWHEWAGTEGNPFEGRVDLEQIALIGHSRGGEAVGHAAAFNRLERYPDDGTVTFDFGYDIRSIIAIAPVDGQYLPTSRKVPVEDVNYLVFHGSHDGDVTSFHGLRQWNRVTFPSGGDRFKSAVYMYRANHGQWNSVWNSFDNGPRSARRLDLRYLVDPAEQRRFAEIYVSAFLDVTLRDEDRWKPLFRDHRVIGEWLPPTMYIAQLEHASFRPLADFEGDIDITTGATSGVTLEAIGVDGWSETTLDLRSSNRATTSASQENQAVRLSWSAPEDDEDGDDSEAADEDAVDEADGPARFELRLNAEAAAVVPSGPGVSLDLQLQWRSEASDDDSTSVARDLTVEIEDAEGRIARVPLATYGPIRTPLEIRILRRSDQEERMEHSETVLQSFHIPFSDFTGVELTSVRAIRLVFDRTPEGSVLVDNIGVSQMDPDWWSARVR